MIAFINYSDSARIAFGVAAALSIVLFIHNEKHFFNSSTITERRIHTVIYMLHPLLLLILFSIWPFVNGVSFLMGIVIPFSVKNLKPAVFGCFLGFTMITLYQLFLLLFAKAKNQPTTDISSPHENI
jgi:hypothetical protein